MSGLEFLKSFKYRSYRPWSDSGIVRSTLQGVGFPRTSTPKREDGSCDSIKDLADHPEDLAIVNILLSGLFVVTGREVKSIDQTFVRISDSDFGRVDDLDDGLIGGRFGLEARSEATDYVDRMVGGAGGGVVLHRSGFGIGREG